MANKNPNTSGLKPFAKGKSGNPNGRPKKIPEIDILLADVLGEKQNGMVGAKAILLKLRNKAIAGDVRAAEVLLDRAYGKSKMVAEIDLTPQPLLPALTPKQFDKLISKIEAASKK